MQNPENRYSKSMLHVVLYTGTSITCLAVKYK